MGLARVVFSMKHIYLLMAKITPDVNNLHLLEIFRNSHLRCSIKKGVLKNFSKFTGNNLCHGLFLNKIAGIRPLTLSKKRPWHMCFPMNLAKFLRTPFYIEHLCYLLLLSLKILAGQKSEKLWNY